MKIKVTIPSFFECISTISVIIAFSILTSIFIGFRPEHLVYTAHHYVIDVLAGIACALIGILGFKYGLMQLPFFRRFFNKYLNYIV
jgi:hypothetical protein